jgi:hypothetical protein
LIQKELGKSMAETAGKNVLDNPSRSFEQFQVTNDGIKPGKVGYYNGCDKRPYHAMFFFIQALKFRHISAQHRRKQNKEDQGMDVKSQGTQ